MSSTAISANCCIFSSSTSLECSSHTLYHSSVQSCHFPVVISRFSVFLFAFQHRRLTVILYTSGPFINGHFLYAYDLLYEQTRRDTHLRYPSLFLSSNGRYPVDDIEVIVWVVMTLRP